MKEETQALISMSLSIIAFVVSGIALGWTIYRDLIDKGRLRIRLMIGRLVPATGGAQPMFVALSAYRRMLRAEGASDDGGPDLLIATITNVGRRPIVASRWGARLKSKQWFKKTWHVIIARELPKTLNPGEFTHEWIENLTVIEGEVRGVFVSDTVGRKWWVSRRNLRRTRADAAEVVRQREQGANE